MSESVSSTAPIEMVRTSARSAEDLVEAWFVETFHNVPGLGTELFNRFQDAKERLKEQLRAAAKE